jgi:hypothetical protein
LKKPRIPILKIVQPHHDGVGAQVLRILSGYAIARRWRLGFYYDLLESVDNQIFEQSSECPPEWNSFLHNHLPRTTNELPVDLKTISHVNHRPLVLYSSIKVSELLGREAIHEISSPHVVTNQYPSLFDGLDFGDLNMLYSRGKGDKKFRIVLHIRQGELVLSQFRERYLELSYFENVLNAILPTLENFRINYEVFVVTEPGQDNLLCGSEPKILESLRIDPSNRNLKKIDDDTYKILREVPDPIHTPLLSKARWTQGKTSWADFQLFLSADLFIMSKSSFSYLAGVINRKALVIYPEFWHPRLARWQTLKHLDQLHNTLIEKVKTGELNS